MFLARLRKLQSQSPSPGPGPNDDCVVVCSHHQHDSRLDMHRALLRHARSYPKHRSYPVGQVFYRRLKRSGDDPENRTETGTRSADRDAISRTRFDLVP